MTVEADIQQPTYVIPARTLSGSVPELLDEIDDMVDALLMVRGEIVRRAPKPATPTRWWRSALRRAWRVALHSSSAKR